MTDRYETLRTAKAMSLERDLFVQQGMIGWMKAWASYLPPEGERRCSEVVSIEEDTSGGIGEEALPTGSNAQVVSILAGIVSSVLRS